MPWKLAFNGGSASNSTGKVFEVDGGVEHPAFSVPIEPL
jgi:hypothetical protein